MRAVLEGELAAEHRGEHQHPVALLRKVAEATGDHSRDALRDGEPRARLVELLEALGARRRTVSPTKSGFPSVSAWSAATSSGRRRRRRRQLDVLGHIALAQPAQREPPGHRFARELGERRTRADRPDRVDVPVASRRQAFGCRRARGRGTAATAARVVGGVQIVEGEHERLRRDGASRNSAVESNRRNRAPSDSTSGRGESQNSSRSSGRICAISAAPAPSWARSASGPRRGRSRAAPAPKASRPERRLPPSSARRGRERHAPARARSAPRPGGSCRYRAPPRGGRGGRARRSASSSPEPSSATSASRPTKSLFGSSVAWSLVARTSAGPAGGSPRGARGAPGRARYRAPRPAPPRPGRPRAPRPGARAVQREHQLSAQPLAEGIPR